MSKVLIKFEANYADEFDVHGLNVLSVHQWEKLQHGIKTDSYPKEYYFGTNEELLFGSADDVFSAIEVTEITDEEFKVFKKLLFRPTAKFRSDFNWGLFDINYLTENH